MLRSYIVLIILALVLGAVLTFPGVTSAGAQPPAACRREFPQRFLMRKSYVRHRVLDARAHARALKWRAKTYGAIAGITPASDAQEPVSAHVRSTTFMGLPIVLHEKVVPKLRCVERRILRQCKARKNRYVPRTIGGLRTTNTAHHGEVSNHLFGIAIDIDPDRNPCCHCVDPWPSHPACKDPNRSVYERTELPRCWIQAFKRYGFHWLGDDQLEDTMHFEYLGDPDRRQR
ncbi:MAG: M15 family metallopeptidase [Polyangiaceae bacterium]|nr:M15 family metallopeptidase [Polyangiaceae bacterium]